MEAVTQREPGISKAGSKKSPRETYPVTLAQGFSSVLISGHNGSRNSC